MHRQHVDIRQQPFDAIVIHGVASLFGIQRFAIVIVNRHVKTARTPRHNLTDPAHAEYAEPLAGGLAADHEVRAPVFPLLAAHQALAFAGPARGTEHQQYRDFRGGIRQHVGRVGDNNAFLPRRVQINVIDADREVGNRFHAHG